MRSLMGISSVVLVPVLESKFQSPLSHAQMFICIIVAMLPVLTDRASGAGEGVLCGVWSCMPRSLGQFRRPMVLLGGPALSCPFQSALEVQLPVIPNPHLPSTPSLSLGSSPLQARTATWTRLPPSGP